MDPHVTSSHVPASQGPDKAPEDVSSPNLAKAFELIQSLLTTEKEDSEKKASKEEGTSSRTDSVAAAASGGRTKVQPSTAEAVLANYSASLSSPKLSAAPNSDWNDISSMSSDMIQALNAPNVTAVMTDLMSKLENILRQMNSLLQKIVSESTIGAAKNAVDESKATIGSGEAQAKSLDSQASQQEAAAVTSFVSAAGQGVSFAGQSLHKGDDANDSSQKIQNENDAIDHNNKSLASYSKMKTELAAMKPTADQNKDADKFLNLRAADAKGELNEEGKTTLDTLKAKYKDANELLDLRAKKEQDPNKKLSDSDEKKLGDLQKTTPANIFAKKAEMAEARYDYVKKHPKPTDVVFTSYKENDKNSVPADKFEETINENTIERQKHVTKETEHMHSSSSSIQQRWNMGSQIWNQVAEGSKSAYNVQSMHDQSEQTKLQAQHDALRAIQGSLQQVMQSYISKSNEDLQGLQQQLSSTLQNLRDLAQSAKQAGGH